MTPHEIELAAALGRAAGWVGARFCNDISFKAKTAPESECTDRQRYYMEILAWRYRRQLPTHLVPETKPLALPPVRREPKPRKVRKALEVAREPDLFGTVGQRGSDK